MTSEAKSPTPADITVLLDSIGLPSSHASVNDGVCEADVYPERAYRRLKVGYKYGAIGYDGVCGRLRKAGVVLLRVGYNEIGTMHLVFRIKERVDAAADT